MQRFQRFKHEDKKTANHLSPRPLQELQGTSFKADGLSCSNVNSCAVAYVSQYAELSKTYLSIFYFFV